MNLRKIIREEIENLPSFGKTTCMLVHKSGNIFMSNNDNMLVFSTYEELQNSLNDNFFKIIHYCRDCEEQEQRLKRLIEKTEAYEKYGPSQRYEPSYRTNYGALTMKEPYKYDPREFEVVEYYQGFIPKTSNIFESEKKNDFDWSENTGYEFTKEINTEEANQNFKNEVNGYYAISTPKGKDFPETILAYGPVFYIKQVLSYINDLDDPYWGNMDLYLGVVKYSRKDKDNVLSLTKYY